MIIGLRKALSAVLSLGILMTVPVNVFAEDTDEDIYREIAADEAYCKASAVLSGLGYIESTEDPEAIEGTVMREEYAVMAANVLGLENGGVASYEDVDEYSSDAAAIGALTAAGYVSGYGNEFRPYDDVLYEDALAVSVRLLGYGGAAAAVEEPYPGWYIAQAGRLNLTHGVSGKVGEPIKYREAIKLMYNVINTGILEIEKIHFDGRVDYRESDTTLLEEKHGIYKANGIVTANYLTGLMSPDPNISENAVKINNTVYDVSESSILYGERAYLAAMLGYNTEYYYYGENNENELVYLYKLDKNNEISINSDDITKASLSQIDYITDSGRNKTINLSRDTYFIFNGKADSAAADADLMPESGNLRLVDNDNDGRYKIVFITSYEDYYVSSINYDDKIIYDNDSERGQSRILSFGNKEIVVFTDGEEDDFEGVMKNSVISVCMSKDGELYTIYMGIDEAEGRVEGQGTDGTSKYLVIEGERYTLAPNYKNEVKAGDEGTFYLDYAGKIAGIKFAGTGKRRYGILWTAYGDENVRQNGDPTPTLEIYTSDSVWEKYPCRERITIDGKRVKNDTVIKYLSNFTRDVIGYELNADNEITLIDTPVAVSDNSVQPFEDKNDNLMERYPSGYRTYKGAYKSFVKYTGVDSMFLSPNAVIFGVGTDVKNDMVKERVMTMTSSNFWSDADFKVRGFSTDSELVDVVVYTEQRSARTSNSPLCLVTNSSEACDENGDIRYRLTGLRDGREFSINIEEGSKAEEVAKTLVKGDCVVLLANLNGEVFDLIKLFDYSTKKVAGNLDSALNTSRGLYGTISRYEHNILWTATAAQTQYYAVVGTKVYIYDTRRNTAELGKTDDIQQGQTALVRVADELVKEVVIFK